MPPANTPSIKVIPEPKEVVAKGKPVRLEQIDAILANRADRFVADILQKTFKDLCHLEIPILESPEASGAGKAVVIGIPNRDPWVAEFCSKYAVEFPEELGDEGYVLVVDEGGILVAAKGGAGVFYGVQTLVQVLESGCRDGELPGLCVQDWPDMRYRGLLVDISRGPVPRMDYLKKVIHIMARFKLNMLTLYTEHMFAFKKHPVIGPPGAALTAEEIRALGAYARQHYVELVGNFQSLGHFRNILKHREYRDLAETPFRWVISPAKEGTYKLLEELYSEIVPAYESKWFIVGCDEAWHLGEGASKAWAEKIGVDGVYLEHLLKLREILRRYGKRMMFWGDMVLKYPRLISRIPKDVVVLNWAYSAQTDYRNRVKAFAKADVKQLVCPGVCCWNRIFPDYINATLNIQNFVREGYRGGALGMLNTAWSDDGENLFGYNWYGILWGAECAWGPERANREAFDEKFSPCFYGADLPEVTQAIELLGSCEHVIRPKYAFGIKTDALFWEDLFNAETPKKVKDFREKIREVGRRAEEAKTLLEKAVSCVKRERENLDSLMFAARRMALLARKFLEGHNILAEYRSLSKRPFEAGQAASKLEALGWRLAELRAQMEDLEDEYGRLWLKEYRPFWLEVNLARYDALIKRLETRARRLLRVAKECARGKPLPPTEILLKEGD